MNKSRLNIALVGVTNHGQTILRMIRACDKLTLRSCYDIDSEASSRVASETGCKAEKSYDDLLADAGLDAVALITPNFVHLDQAVRALEAGKHVFIEKPLATNVREGQNIVEAADKSGRILQVGHNTRKRKSFREARRFIDSGELGEIVSVYANMSFDFGLTKEVPEWKKQKEKCQLLPMTQLGIHFVDTLQYLIGPISMVTCVQRSAYMRNKKGESVTDSVAATLSFENGVIGTIQSDYVSTSTYLIMVSGTNAKITCSDSSILVEKRQAGKIETETISAEEKLDGESYFAEIEEFAECALTGRAPEVDGQSGLRNLAVVEAMLESAETGRIVSVAATINRR
jgi:predicted dehydrogenase